MIDIRFAYWQSSPPMPAPAEEPEPEYEPLEAPDDDAPLELPVWDDPPDTTRHEPLPSVYPDSPWPRR